MTTKTIAPFVGERTRLPEAQPAPSNLPATISRNALVHRSPQRRIITADLLCRVRWQTYRAEFRLNLRANTFICQTIKPKTDADVTATSASEYSAADLRLTDVRCPGCRETVSFPTCRFENGLTCDALGRADPCPGWCDALGLRG